MTRPPDQPSLPDLFDQVEPVKKPLAHRDTVLLSVDAIYERADQSMLRILKEDKRVERKPVNILKSHELADYFSMWANTAPEGGLIVVGIADDGKALGCLNTEIEHLNKLEEEACHQCANAQVDCRRVEIVRDKDGQPDIIHLYRVRYNPTRVVFTTRNEAFIRRGDSKHKLTHQEIIDLRNDKGERRIEQDLCPSYAFPDDFDNSLIERFADGVRRSSNLMVNFTTEQILVGRKLGEIKDGRFVPNGACVLVFANDPRHSFAGSKVHLLRYEGEHEGVGTALNAVKHEMAEGNIPTLLDVSSAFLSSQLRTYSALGPDNRFYPSPEYPQAAWYEALVNACVHRSYGTFKAMTMYVKMFDNRLEVESPGGFPPGVTAENIYDISSHPRNPFIMDALWFMGYVKNIGEGTRRMQALMHESSLPAPEFRQKEIGHSVVRVTLRNNYTQRKVLIDSAVAASIISPEISKTLSEDERLVVNHLAEHITINSSQASRITNRGWKSAHRLLMKMAARGILIHNHRRDIERDPDAHFVLAPRVIARPDSTEMG